MINRTGVLGFLFCGEVGEDQCYWPEEGILQERHLSENFFGFTFRGGVRQLAGLSSIQLTGLALGVGLVCALRRFFVGKLRARYAEGENYA